MAQAKAFTAKGIKPVSPKGEALWCKVTEPDYKFNDKGQLSTDLVCDPNDPTVVAYISKLEGLRDLAYDQIMNDEGEQKIKPAKKKQIIKADVFKEEYDKDGEPTGNIIFTYKLKNVDDRDKGKDKVSVIDGDRVKIAHDDIPKVGNGSIIRCKSYCSPYYMPATNMMGVSHIWEVMQLITLNEYSGGDDDGFDDEDGFSSTGGAADGFDDDSKDDTDDGDY